MNRLRWYAARILVLTGMAWMLASCAITESTTETMANTVEASTDFTSSTSPRDSSSAADQKIYAFTTVNFDRIREDMARGEGEYLASLASLLGVPETEQPAFFAMAKEKFPVLFRSEQTTPEEMLANLQSELAAHPEMRS